MKTESTIKSGKTIIRILMAVLLVAFVVMQTQCASSKYGQVPCPCEKKSHRR